MKRFVYEFPCIPSELRTPETEREKSYLSIIESLAVLVQTDYMTGLLHKAEFERRVKQYVGEGAYIFIDGDDLKAANDQFGHKFGDLIICAISNSLKEELRMRDDIEIMRFGGDEFVVFIKNGTKDLARIIAHRIFENIHQQKIVIHDHSINPEKKAILKHFPIRASIGVGETIEEADSAMYHAKKLGKDRIE